MGYKLDEDKDTFGQLVDSVIEIERLEKRIAELEAALEYYAPDVQDSATLAKARETLGKA